MTREQRKALRTRQLEGWRRSGLTQQAYCTREGISCETFRRWRRKLGGQAGALPATVRIVPVRLADRSLQAAPGARGESTELLGQPLEVVLSSGRRLRFAHGLDQAGLARLIRVLEALAC